MEIVNFSDIYDTFMKNLKRKMIIPIIGSGFTLNSEAKNGKVPSGKDYQEHMIDSLCNKFEELKDSKEKMYNEPFSQIAELYIKQIDDIDKRNYFVSNSHNKCSSIWLSSNNSLPHLLQIFTHLVSYTGSSFVPTTFL